MKNTCVALLLLQLFSFLIYAQVKSEEGYPQIQNYSPKDYGGDIQNWAIEQDKSGVMYFGNNLGLLEYDGAYWKMFKIPGSVVRSMYVADDGKIYAGSVGNFGYFSPDIFGDLKYHSLSDLLAPEYKNFSDVWDIVSYNDEIIFTTSVYIFRWSYTKKTFSILKSANNFHLSGCINNTYYVREWGTGILRLEGDSLKLIPGSEKFADERIYIFLPFPGEKNVLLIGTRKLGFFKYDGKNFTPFKTEADEYFKEKLIYFPGRITRDGNISIISLNGGTVIINKSGELVSIMDKAAGLPSNTLFSQFIDRSGALWLATDYGLSRVSYNSPITYFDSRNELSNSISAIKRYKGILYAASGAGVFYLDPETKHFKSIPDLKNQAFYFAEVNGKLLGGTLDGLFEIEKDKAKVIRRDISNDFNTQFIYQSKINPDRLYIATGLGMSLLVNENGKWIDKGKLLNINDFSSSIVEEEDGSLWTGTGSMGIFHIEFPVGTNNLPDFSKPKIIRYGAESNAPLVQVYPFKIDNKIYFFDQSKVYRYNEQNSKFYVDSTLMVVPPSGVVLPESIVKDELNRLWLGTGKQPVLGYPQPDGTYKWEISLFRRFGDEISQCIFVEDTNTIWFGTGFGIIKYEFNKKSDYDERFSLIISSAQWGKDNRKFYRAYNSVEKPPEITFSNNSAKFVFAAAYYEEEKRNLYKTYLEGFDDGWSGWSKENIKEYTNLPPGKYRFKVVAKNLNDVLSNEASFTFTILPPWYRTWWAYLFYLLLLCSIVYGFTRFIRRRVLLKEREHSYIRETELRAEAAEAENERKKNVELLSEIGRDITANLTVEKIIDTVYKNVNSLMDASVFGIGLFDSAKNSIIFPAAKEKGQTLKTFSTNINDENRPAVWCFKNQKDVMINDYSTDYSKYIKELKAAVAGENPESMLYLPLNYKDKKIGVITAQSFKKDAYTDYHLNILRNLATYTAIALDNADAYMRLNETVEKLNKALNDLKSTQEKLIVQQKLASLGQLTAGIAHEIKNPLNFVNNFSKLGKELIGELKEELEKIKDVPADVIKNIDELVAGVELNILKINEHGSRANRIVNSMLQHSRGKVGEKKLSDINAILDEDLNLAYHGFRARDTSFDITIEKEYDPELDQITIVPQDVSRVFLNIINNGFYETHKKKKEQNGKYTPILKVHTCSSGDCIEIRIRDNGNGVPKEIRDSLFNPFFTTKPAGEGTGLGLSLSYDIIVKGHKGEIKFETCEGEFTEFIISFPKQTDN